MTASGPAAATQTRARVSQAMQPKLFFMPDALAATLPIFGCGDQLRIRWLAYPEARLRYEITKVL